MLVELQATRGPLFASSEISPTEKGEPGAKVSNRSDIAKLTFLRSLTFAARHFTLAVHPTNIKASRETTDKFASTGTHGVFAATSLWRRLPDRMHFLQFIYAGVPMTARLSRRDVLKLASAGCLTAVPMQADAGPHTPPRADGVVRGHMTGAAALVETLIAEGCGCVFGIPGAQQNELWDTMKTKQLRYLLVTHEFSASTMADGYARSTGMPGVLCVVPGPGLTNAISGIGEALLDSVPMVCIVGDIGNGRHYRPFQVHSLPQVGLLRNVTKEVLAVQHVADIPAAVRQAFLLARSGEPGPVGVVVPYNLLLEAAQYDSPPLAGPALPFAEIAYRQALCLLQDRRLRIGIYAGLGCMPYAPALVRLAEVLQAPVATSIAGKGVIPENHPLAVGWGYGPQGTRTAESIFNHVDLVLAIGVKFSEVSTGFYSQPQKRHLIHVDINEHNLGRIMRTDVCINADAGLFIQRLLDDPTVARAPDAHLTERIQAEKNHEAGINRHLFAPHPHPSPPGGEGRGVRGGADPMAFLLALRRCTEPDAMAFVDVTVSQYWATEVFTANMPRTFFNPTNNQAMGWSIPAALGAQAVHHGRQVVTITGDGCLLMSAMEISTAAREGLPVKFFVLDDQAYHYMQRLQMPAYLQTTATILTRLDYAALARGWGVGYQEITCTADLEPGIRGALDQCGPVLCRIVTDYRHRPIRWIDAARARFTRELDSNQQTRFAMRIGSRAVHVHPTRND